MATYRVTGPDGAVYNVTPPEGTNPSESEILAQIQAQHGKGSPQPSAPTSAPQAPRPDTRNALTRGYQDYIAKPLTTVMSAAAQGPAAFAADLASGQTKSAGPSKTAGELIVPQTPTQAGMMAGTAGMGGLAARGGLGVLSRFPALSRILGGALGGEAGSQLEGRQTGSGFTEGAIGGAVGEGIGKAIPLARRIIPGAKGRIAARDAAEYGRVLGEASPPLAGAKTVQDLHGLASGGGQKLLGAAKDQVNREVGQFAGVNVEVPSLGQNIRVVEPIKGYAGATHAVQKTKPLTLQEANNELSAIGARAFSQNPMDRNFNGIDQRRLYGQVRKEIVDSLERVDPTGYAASAWQKIQQHYERGLAGLEPLQSASAFRPGQTSAQAQFNTPYVQDYFRNPKNMGELRDRFGDENVQALVDAITRGGGALSRDILAPGRGGATDALMQTYGRGQGGSPQVLGSLLRTAAPNFGSSYAGRSPQGSLPPALQQILDMVMQRGVNEAQR